MKGDTKDWSHIILKHLFKEYTVFDVHFKDNFLSNKLGIGQRDGNLGRKLVRTLQELEEKKLVVLRISDHNNQEVVINTDPNDNTSITLDKYWFHVRLTFDGLVYIGNYLRIKKQDTFTIISLVILGLTGIFVFMSAYYSSQGITSKEWKKVDTTLQLQGQSLDSIHKTQQEINYSLHEMNQKSDSIKKVMIVTKHK
jgi:hypothetical protein